MCVCVFLTPVVRDSISVPDFSGWLEHREGVAAEQQQQQQQQQPGRPLILLPPPRADLLVSRGCHSSRPPAPPHLSLHPTLALRSCLVLPPLQGTGVLGDHRR